MALKITAPSTVTGDSTFGPVTLSFEDGVAEADAVSDGLRNYLEKTGYTVEKPKPARRRTAKSVDEDGETNAD